MRPTPENITFRFPSDADEQRQQEIRNEANEDMESGLKMMELPGAEHELPQEAWEQEIIGKVDREIRRYFSEELDVQVGGLDAQHVHFYDPEDFKELMSAKTKAIRPEVAQATTAYNHVLLTDEARRSSYPQLKTTKLLIHEALHSNEFKKFTEWRFPESNGGTLKVVMTERAGISMSKRSRHREHRFTGFQEGITEVLSHKILDSIVHHDPAYQNEINRRFSKIDEKIGRDTLFKKWGAESYDFIDGDFETNQQGKQDIAWQRSGTYMDEQDLIHFLARRMAAADPEHFKNSEEALNLFFKAQYKGELLPLAKAIDGTFGNGTLRLLAAIPESHESENLFAKNALSYLRLPVDKRDPEIARQYIFGEWQDHPEQFEKYVRQVRSQNKSGEVNRHTN